MNKEPKMSISRRRFVASLGAAATAALTFPIRPVYGANDAINLGFLGVGDRGGYSASWFSKLPNIRVAALCDADESRLAAQQKKYPSAKAEQDLRKVIENKDIDAVVISTCNHWHALAAVWACQAGKDVYVEKPVSNNVWEGRKIVEAARKYKRIVQGGTQQRSDPVQAQIRDLIKSEKLGKMLWIRGNRFGVRESIGKQPEPLKPPATVNYDLWLGPAQDKPMHRTKFHYDWHWDWNTGAGEMGNWGVHVLDDIRNMLGDPSLPRRILSAGGRVVWDDAGETPNVHVVYFDTGVVPVVFSLSNLPRSKAPRDKSAAINYRDIQSGYVIQFENGYYAGGRGGGKSFDKDGKRLEIFKGDGGGEHAKNFIDAITRRDPSIQNGEIEQVHYSSSWCHLANVAYRLGQNYSTEKVPAKSFAPWKELLEQFETHVEIHAGDLAKGNLKISTMLDIDPQRETFTGPAATPEALALLKREYRKGYEMPQIV
jgi:predicted dehydrogenase